MRKTVWITRTEPNAQASANAFERAGFKTVIAPLLKVEAKGVVQTVADEAVLIFTSQNGLRSFCQHDPRRDLSVITVGDGTAALAREMGFKDVRSAGGTSEDIAPLIARAPNKTAHYIYISGVHVRGTVSEDIAALGLKAERRIYYGSAPVAQLPDIELAVIDCVALFSPLAAQTLARLAPDVSHISALSISSATDDALSCLQFKSRHIATAPSLERLIAAAKGTG